MHPLLMEKSPTGVFSTAAPMPIETYPEDTFGYHGPKLLRLITCGGTDGHGHYTTNHRHHLHTSRKQIVMGARLWYR